ncbi:hypothetical protein KC356_g117 [Hortaea werneckii]|nr:hypothetical protein KC356_g117 [Hortaea werneckii]
MSWRPSELQRLSQPSFYTEKNDQRLTHAFNRMLMFWQDKQPYVRFRDSYCTALIMLTRLKAPTVLPQRRPFLRAASASTARMILDDIVNIALAPDFNLRLATEGCNEKLCKVVFVRVLRFSLRRTDNMKRIHIAFGKLLCPWTPYGLVLLVVKVTAADDDRMDIAPFIARLPVHSMEPVLARIKALNFYVCRSILDQRLRFQRFSIQRANDSVDPFQLILELVLGYVEQVDCATLIMLRLRHIWARRQGAFECQYVECLVGAFEERFRDHLAQLSVGSENCL